MTLQPSSLPELF
ncbi:TPA: hypothetical protein ISB17_005004, partial [Escherichia coli]|nr:hypothetical protein [Escherichia coli]